MIHTRWLMNRGAVIVTGGSKRIGREICIHLSRIGFKILIHHRNSASDAEETARIIISNGGLAAICQADLSEVSSAKKLVQSAIENFGEVSGIVNNASVFIHDDISSLSSDSWDNHMNVNAKVPTLLIREMYKSLKDGFKASVVNILDQKLSNPNPDYLSYTASKYVMLGLTESLSRGLAPNVRVNAVAPGAIDTPMLASYKKDLTLKEYEKRMRENHPIGRIGKPTEVANVIYFLASDAASFMTGLTIPVDGGRSIR